MKGIFVFESITRDENTFSIKQFGNCIVITVVQIGKIGVFLDCSKLTHY